MDTPAPASQSSSPMVVDPPMVQEVGATTVCKPGSVKEQADAQADHRASYREADVQSQWHGVQVAQLWHTVCTRYM